MTEPTCQNCRYWREDGGYLETIGYDAAVGECRRYAPRCPGNGQALGPVRWPLTLATMWCGEHASAGKTPEELLLAQSIWHMKQFSIRTRNACERLGIATLGDLIRRGADDLLEARNFGKTSLAEVREILATLGLSLCGDQT